MFRLSPPRKELEALGITYGRIPVDAVGKDVYCDSSFQLATLQSLFPTTALSRTATEDAYRAWGTELRQMAVALNAVTPAKAFTPEFIADRAKIFREQISTAF